MVGVVVVDRAPPCAAAEQLEAPRRRPGSCARPAIAAASGRRPPARAASSAAAASSALCAPGTVRRTSCPRQREARAARRSARPHVVGDQLGAVRAARSSSGRSQTHGRARRPRQELARTASRSSPASAKRRVVVELDVRQHARSRPRARAASGRTRRPRRPATRPSPQWPFASPPPTGPPISQPGSSPAPRSAWTTIDEVVVLPCVPADRDRAPQRASARRAARARDASGQPPLAGRDDARGCPARDGAGVDHLDPLAGREVLAPRGRSRASSTPVGAQRRRYGPSAASEPLTSAPSAWAARA